MLVGLTGGIGSGKSTIARGLEAMGYPVYYTDQEAKRIIETNPAVRSEVEHLFGADVYVGNHYQTQRVAEAVFRDATLLARLNHIVHPAVCFDVHRWSRQHELCFVESAILFESGLSEQCDRVVAVTAPEELRLQRTIARDGSNINKVRARMRAQLSDEELALRSDLTILNNETEPVSELCLRIIYFLKNLPTTGSAESGKSRLTITPK